MPREREEVNVSEVHSEAVEEIARRHAKVRERLNTLGTLVHEMDSKGAVFDDPERAQYAAVLDELVGFFTQDVCELMQLEEEALFPPLGRDLSEIGGPVVALELEHDELRRLIRAFAQAVEAWSDGASDRVSVAARIASCVRRLRGLLLLHLEKEEAVLFRLIPKVFTQADARRASARVRLWRSTMNVLVLTGVGIGVLFGSAAFAQHGMRSAERRFTVQAEMRTRWEGRWGELLGQPFQAGVRDSYLLTRVRVGVDMRPTRWLRFFLQGQDAQALHFRADPDPPLVEDTFDVRQAYVEIFDRQRQGLGLQIGRQEVRFGDERLLGAFDWGNTARTFDAIRLVYARPWARVDLFAASVVVIEDGAFNRHRAGENLYGAYGSFREAIPDAVVEGYVVWRTRPHVVGERGQRGDADVVTVGTRWAGELPAAFDYRVEIAGQWGRWARDRVRAWAWHVQLGYRVASARMIPRLLIEYNHASGDRDPTDGRRETFDQLFPTNHDKYGIADIVGWQNMRNVRVGAGVRPGRRLTAQLDYHSFWLVSRRDALYGAGGTPIARLSTADHTHIGHEVDVDVRITLSGALSLGAGYAHLFPGRFLKQAAPGANVTFAYTMMTYRF